MWLEYNDIATLPEGLWDSLVAHGDVCLDVRLIRVAQKIYTRSRFSYFIRYTNDRPSAIFMAVKTGNIAETGCDETSGRHFWFDPQVLTFEEFVAESSALINCEKIVYRDFFGDFDSPYTRVMDVSRIDVPQGVATWSEYISTLKYKYRYQLARYSAALDRKRYEVVRITDFVPLLDSLYPLYLEVCARAAEYTAEPHPKEYFSTVKEVFGDDAVMTVIRERDGAYLGFMLLLYREHSCVHQYIGFRRIDNLYLWHNLTLESIADAISRGVKNINMGVTNAVAKHKFGAVSTPCYILERNFKVSSPSG